MSRPGLLCPQPARRSAQLIATGRAPTVHNIKVNNTHTYHTTTTTGTHILAHNGCTTDFAEPVLAEQ